MTAIGDEQGSLATAGRLGSSSRGVRDVLLQSRLPFVSSFILQRVIFMMAQPSEDDKAIISRYPLGDTLDIMRNTFQETEKQVTPETPTHISQKALSRLLSIMMCHDAALNLKARISGVNLASEIAQVFSRIQARTLTHDHFWPLALSILGYKRDVEIWGAVFSMLEMLAQHTPPASIQQSLDQTPVVRCSSSIRGSEQTKRNLEPALFYEVNCCTFRNVRGFFEKYFEDKSWERRSKVILRSVKSQSKAERIRYDSSRWAGIGDRPKEEEIWDWLCRFQEEYLSKAPSQFHAARQTKNLTGAEAKRQLDVLVKKRTHGARTGDDKHNWADVLVIGELKQSEQDFKSLLLQLSRYARDVFTAQPTRRFLHAFTMQGRKMETWVFDRSGPYSAGEFDIHEEPEKFVRVVVGYASMTDQELGLDMCIERIGNDSFVEVSNDACRKRERLQLEAVPFVKQRATVCRGTTCFRSIDHKTVIKFSWTSDQRQCESDLLQLARQKGVTGVAALVGYERFTTIDELRSGLTFPPPYRFRASAGVEARSSSISRSFGAFQKLSVSGMKRKCDGEVVDDAKRSRSNSYVSRLCEQYPLGQVSAQANTSLYGMDSGNYSNRVFGCLAISPAGRALSTFQSVEELLTALRDAIDGHRSLYIDGGILHRDISENNIIIVKESEQGDGRAGMLIDLDLAKVAGSGPSGARHQTGTVEFMAIQVLQKAPHTFRHDLESFFYVLLWVCARRSWEVKYLCSPSNRPKTSRLGRWYSGTFDQIAEAKRGYMHVDGLEDILREFPAALQVVKPLCREIRGILFPLRPTGELETGTHLPAPELYSKIIAAYEASLAKIEGEAKS